MKAALQIYSRDFDADFFKLPLDIQRRIEDRVDRLGLRLDRFSHTHLTGMDCCRLRVGDYRVVYITGTTRVQHARSTLAAGWALAERAGAGRWGLGELAELKRLPKSRS